MDMENAHSADQKYIRTGYINTLFSSRNTYYLYLILLPDE